MDGVPLDGTWWSVQFGTDELAPTAFNLLGECPEGTPPGEWEGAPMVHVGAGDSVCERPGALTGDGTSVRTMAFVEFEFEEGTSAWDAVSVHDEDHPIFALLREALGGEIDWAMDADG